MTDPNSWPPGSEERHEPGADPGWAETWCFEFGSLAAGIGGFAAVTLLPALRRAWYWSALVRAGQPLLHLVDLDVQMPRQGLELRAEGLWADHICEAPLEQWTVANECMAVALDDPGEALGRAFGVQAPMAMDLEWYASGPPRPIDLGYRQAGEVEGVVELVGSRLEVSAPARRWHRWGIDAWRWTEPELDGAATAGGLKAPIRVGDVVLERVLSDQGWSQRAFVPGPDAAGTRSPPATG
ncbi:MAG: hypothetical protein JWL70_2037 [Acidimicrobiia bacterium]|nr:hypothetical protein [Acidimicrobiia bacterium]